jgi:hypothetical protein
LSLANWKITAGGKTPSIQSINNSAILYGINHPFGIPSPRFPVFIFPAYIAVQKENDADSDGVPNSLDWCFNSATAPTIFAGFCDTGVANQVLENGCTMQDRINGCVSRGFNGWASLQRPCLSLLLNSWIIRGLITQDEKQMIQNCAEQAQTPE